MAELTGNEPVSTGNLKALMDWSAQGRDISVSTGSVAIRNNSNVLSFTGTADFSASGDNGVKCLRGGVYEVNVSSYVTTSSNANLEVFYDINNGKKGHMTLGIVTAQVVAAFQGNTIYATGIFLGSDRRLVELSAGDTIAFLTNLRFNGMSAGASFSITRLYAR